MSLKDMNTDNLGEFTKLKDYPDYTELKVIGAGIKSGGKYGDSPYFVNENGDTIFLPTRYTDTINNIINDELLLSELNSGAHIVKHSKQLKNGMITTTFEFI